MISSTFTRSIQSKILFKRGLFSRKKKPEPPCPPLEKKKPCDCPPPNLHKECRDDLSKQIMSTNLISAAQQSEADQQRKKWKMITFFVALPVVLAFSLSTLLMGEEDHRRPPFVEYDYMYRRLKPYPWGDGKRTLFHNPCKNALPGIGYEDDKCPSIEHTKEEKEEEDEENEETSSGENSEQSTDEPAEGED